MLSNVYFIVLCAVGVAILAAVLDAVVSVSRARGWRVDRPALMLVESVDRRSDALPFVGAERREPLAGAVVGAEERKAA